MSALSCQVCHQGQVKYHCPRCNIAYCCIACYQSPSHYQCSESFYKECVEKELSASVGVGNLSKQKTIDILKQNHDDAEQEELDSDDDEDLSSRFANVDLDDGDQIWSLLTPEERKDFEQKLSSGEIYKLVPSDEKQSFEPWWEIRHDMKKKVEEIDPDHELKLNSNLPPLREPEASIDTRKASPLVQCNLTSVLFAYVIAYRHLSWHLGEHSKEAIHEFASLIFHLSANLSSNETFASAEEAISSASQKALDLCGVDTGRIKLGRDDLTCLFTGHEGSLYLLAALSDIKAILGQASKLSVKNEHFSRKQCVAACKKMDFYTCWVQQH